MTSSSLDGAQLFARVARELAELEGTLESASRIVELARTLLGCDTAAVWKLTRPDHAALLASNESEAGAHFASIINTLREGIAWDCLAGSTTIRVGDLQADDRWPRYREVVLAHTPGPLRAFLGFSLDFSGHNVGALVLASAQPDYFTEQIAQTASVFAAHAAICLEGADNRNRVEHLQRALDSNRRIGIALGIVMNQQRLTETAAFDLLRFASQNTHVKLSQVAEEVVLTGALPELPARGTS